MPRGEMEVAQGAHRDRERPEVADEERGHQGGGRHEPAPQREVTRGAAGDEQDGPNCQRSGLNIWRMLA